MRTLICTLIVLTNIVFMTLTAVADSPTAHSLSPAASVPSQPISVRIITDAKKIYAQTLAYGNQRVTFGLEVTNLSRNALRFHPVLPTFTGPHGPLKGEMVSILNGAISLDEYPLIMPGETKTLTCHARLVWVSGEGSPRPKRHRSDVSTRRRPELILDDGSQTTMVCPGVAPGVYTVDIRLQCNVSSIHYPGGNGDAVASPMWIGDVTSPFVTVRLINAPAPMPIRKPQLPDPFRIP